MGDKSHATDDKAKSLSELMERKLELAAKIHELDTEIARINLQMHKMGAQSIDVICW